MRLAYVPTARGAIEMSSTLRTIGLGLGLATALGIGSAQAAPQALALVASGGDVSLTCDGTECKAEMSAFCLQHDRMTPIRGTRYDLVDGSDLILKGETADGREVVLDSGKLRFATERTHVAMRVSLPQEEMEALGVTKVRINVGENVALLPEPEANDSRPQQEADLLILAGPLRQLGAKLVDRNQRHMVAARLTNRMINEVPTGKSATAADGEQVWRTTIDAMQGQELSSEGVGLARRAVDFCKFAIGTGAQSSMQGCLQSEHDDFLKILNSNYWTAVKTGS
jgi:hypothetical protein